MWIEVLRKDHEVCELQRSPEVTNARISKLWVELHFRLWEYRNKCVHGPGGWSEQRETPLLDREIRREYATGSETLDGEQMRILKKTMAEVLKLPLVKKKQWLDTVQRSREAHNIKE